MSMDKRVNCMACLVADENGMKVGVVTRAGITHALSKAGNGHFYPLCAFDNNGVIKPGLYYTARVYEEDVV